MQILENQLYDHVGDISSMNGSSWSNLDFSDILAWVRGFGSSEGKISKSWVGTMVTISTPLDDIESPAHETLALVFDWSFHDHLLLVITCHSALVFNWFSTGNQRRAVRAFGRWPTP